MPMMNKAVFAIIFTVIQPLNGERVFENIPRHIEGDTMIGFVPCRLDGAPFEFWLVHIYTDYQ